MPRPQGTHHTSTRLSWSSALGLAVLALAIRLLAALLTNAFAHPQLYEYDEIARSLLAGQGFVHRHIGGVPYHSFIMPLYPWITAGVYAVTGGSVVALLLVQMVASTVHVVLMALMGTHLFDRRAGLLGGVLMACHPGLVIYSSLKAHPLTFDALCFTLVFWSIVRLGEQRTLRRSLEAGLIIGVSILSRLTAAIFLPVSAAWLLATAPAKQRTAELGRCAVMAVCASLVIAPWFIRYATLHGDLSLGPVSSHWEVFWLGNNPQATGHALVDANRTILETLPPRELTELKQLHTEEEQAQWFRHQALTFIREHPGACVLLALKKFSYFWWFSPQSGLLYPPLWLRGYQLYYLIVVVLAVMGAQELRRCGTAQQRQPILLVGLFALALSLFQSLYYVEGRHRWAIEPLLLLCAGYGLMRALEAMGLGRRQATG